MNGPSNLGNDLDWYRQSDSIDDIPEWDFDFRRDGNDKTRGIGCLSGPLKGALDCGFSARQGLKGSARTIAGKKDKEILHTVLSIGTEPFGLRKLARHDRVPP